MSLFSELKRRNVFRVAAAYLVMSWLLMQIGDVFVNALELPAIWNKALLALLVIAFIPTLVFSWVYEMTPEGLRRDEEVAPEQSIAVHTARKLDMVVISLLLVAIVVFALDRFVVNRSAITTPTAEPQVAESAAAGVPVVAVLPLQAMSTDQEGEFLAAGLHDDLLTRLARLQAFKVISRTSVMEYASTTKNMRQIGQELGAGFILEGGLQSIGGRVSINAQLIDASNDEHLWAESFNRALSAANLFEVQAEIAGAIAGALHATLSPSDQQVFEERPTDNLAAYRAYLRGLDTATTLTRPAMLNSIASFSRATELDPDFAEAWARLGQAQVRRYWEEGGEADMGGDTGLVKAARSSLDRAGALAPDNVDVLLSEAYFHYYAHRDYSGALAILERAEAQAPHHHRVVALRGFLLRRLGRVNEAADQLLRAIELSPNHQGHIRETISTLRDAGRCDEALAMAENGLEKFPNDTGMRGAAAWAEILCRQDPESALSLAEGLHPTTVNHLEYDLALHQMAGDLEGMIERARDGRQRFPDQAVAQLMMANVMAINYRLLGQPDKARSEREAARQAARAVEVEPVSSAALLQLALEAALRDDVQATLDFGRRGMDRFPNDLYLKGNYWTRVMQAYALAGATDEAIAVLEELMGFTMYAEYRFIQIDPWLAELRQDPRFAGIIARHPWP